MQGLPVSALEATGPAGRPRSGLPRHCQEALGRLVRKSPIRNKLYNRLNVVRATAGCAGSRASVLCITGCATATLTTSITAPSCTPSSGSLVRLLIRRLALSLFVSDSATCAHVVSNVASGDVVAATAQAKSPSSKDKDKSASVPVVRHFPVLLLVGRVLPELVDVWWC